MIHCGQVIIWSHLTGSRAYGRAAVKQHLALTATHTQGVLSSDNHTYSILSSEWGSCTFLGSHVEFLYDNIRLKYFS